MQGPPRKFVRYETLWCPAQVGGLLFNVAEGCQPLPLRWPPHSIEEKIVNL